MVKTAFKNVKLYVQVENMRASSIILLFTLLVAFLCWRDAVSSDFNELPVVKRIEILGNKTFSDGRLKRMMRLKESGLLSFFSKPRFRRDYLKRDVETIRSFYHKNGFFEAVVRVEYVKRDKKSNTVVIRLFINEGPQTKVRSVGFVGRLVIPVNELRKGLNLIEGAPYNPNLLEVDRYSIFSKYLRRGYLGASISYSVKVDSLDVHITWRIDPGDPIRIKGMVIRGNRRVRRELIERELTFRSGEIFNLKNVLESKQNLYDTGLFNSVDIEPESLEVDRRLVNLAISVRERKTGYLETGLGVGNIHGNRISAEWGHRNLFGRGYALNARTSFAFSIFPGNEFNLKKLDYREKFVSHEGELRIPHVLSTWNTLTFGAYYEKDATVEPVVVRSLSFRATVSRRITRQTSLLLGYGLEHIKRFDVEEEKEESRKRSVNFSFTRDTRDYYFNPSTGGYIALEGKVSGGVLGGEDNVYSFVTSFQRYGRIGRDLVLAYRVRTGYSDVFGDGTSYGLPIESRYFTGGGNSVRGYRENSLGPVNESGEPVGGRVLLLTNVELRYPLPFLRRYNFGGALFLDGGNVWQSIEEITWKDFRFFADTEELSCRDYMYSLGFGLRYYTPVGPFRLDIGFPVKRTSFVDYSYWVHLSLGQIF